jgi:hypothetical protein
MRTISNEDHLLFLARAKQKKLQIEVLTVDPLSQLFVEDDDTKGKGKRKP